jgi:hypothetical protein
MRAMRSKDTREVALSFCFILLFTLCVLAVQTAYLQATLLKVSEL